MIRTLDSTTLATYSVLMIKAEQSNDIWKSPYKRLRAGQCPPKGSTVQLCRSNYSSTPTILEQFTADGEWCVPKLGLGFYYESATEEELEASASAFL